jgi:outer membrane immunogenic protein
MKTTSLTRIFTLNSLQLHDIKFGGFSMKRFLGTLLPLALVSVAASAADLPMRAPPAPAAPSWAGFYVGGSAGYAWSNSDPVNTTTTNVSAITGLNGDIGAAIANQGTGSVATKGNGFVGGAQAGYNWQANGFVYGLETDIRGYSNSNHGGSVANTGTVPGAAAPISSTGLITSSSGLSYLGTFRGRVGLLATPSVLLFGTGGLAYGGVKTSTTVAETLGFDDTPGTFGTAGSSSQTRVGWTAGVGAEWLLSTQWSAKVEYRYYDLGSVTNTLPAFQQFGSNGSLLETVNAAQSSTRFAGSDVSFGVNYHF